MIKNINMPNGCRYMSDYPNLLNNILPLHDKFILNNNYRLWGNIHVS